ncbi:LPS export ABC transporter permease LptF [Dechloromonas sp. TW-R-39-2]|jgi:lipopolysaccharide export system permease protein|uniref:LPS export ABC transporter permease LptF n=1 Tax=Dechloromonas TaxID=73029 RepID=UPI00193DF665|nr:MULTISPECIES: LPS export ABC transporter permease LptF [Dechloromonas]QRM19117.1 LPS export ABC transporter permease LptF [Dechloromonas sp. TW-R-39-2]UCV12549.1 LPS export ABC transporter permease LptF [Dechloromonas denitrificans]
MIFERALRREFAQAAAGISVALLAILTSTQLIRLLKDAAGGHIAPEAVASLLGFAALNFMPVLLSLTLFVAILLSLSRAYRDSEMVVWFSCGRSLTAWVSPVLKFALPIVLAIAALSGFLSPWANYSTAQYKQKLSARSDVSQVAPGAFREAKRGQRVFFVEAVTEDASQMGNVFVASFQDGKLGVVMSDAGHQEVAANGDKFVVLEHGRRYEVEPGTPEFKVMEFERYKVRTEDGEARPADRSPNRLPITDLLFDDSAPARGELLWRIGVPVSALILALLAIPLSYVNPRAGRSANMLIAILIYAIYSNLISVSQAWVAQGKLSFWIGVWAVHVVMLLPLVLLFYRRIAIRMPWQRRNS